MLNKTRYSSRTAEEPVIGFGSLLMQKITVYDDMMDTAGVI